MIEILVILIFIISMFSGFMFFGMFLLGQSYNYMTRRKTYNGTKTIICAVICWTLYQLPWQSWGMFTYP